MYEQLTIPAVLLWSIIKSSHVSPSLTIEESSISDALFKKTPPSVIHQSQPLHHHPTEAISISDSLKATTSPFLTHRTQYLHLWCTKENLHLWPMEHITSISDQAKKKSLSLTQQTNNSIGNTSIFDDRKQRLNHWSTENNVSTYDLQSQHLHLSPLKKTSNSLTQGEKIPLILTDWQHDLRLWPTETQHFNLWLTQTNIFIFDPLKPCNITIFDDRRWLNIWPTENNIFISDNIRQLPWYLKWPLKDTILP